MSTMVSRSALNASAGILSVPAALQFLTCLMAFCVSFIVGVSQSMAKVPVNWWYLWWLLWHMSFKELPQMLICCWSCPVNGFLLCLSLLSLACCTSLNFSFCVTKFLCFPVFPVLNVMVLVSSDMFPCCAIQLAVVYYCFIFYAC